MFEKVYGVFEKRKAFFDELLHFFKSFDLFLTRIYRFYKMINGFL